MTRLHATTTFEGLDFRFDVVTDSPRISEHVERLLHALVAPGDAEHRYEIGDGAGPGKELRLDGGRLRASCSEHQAVETLIRDVNARAVAACDDVSLHAGGVASRGRAIVFPAAMESGKTTLVTGLVRAGFEYLSDEAIAIDDDLRARPYAKPLSIDWGSWPLFPDLEPVHDLDRGHDDVIQWNVAPEAVRDLVVAGATPIVLVVFPRYEAGARTVIEPMRRADGILELARHTFRFRERSRTSLDVLSALSSAASCHRLVSGDLAAAVSAVSALADEVIG